MALFSKEENGSLSVDEQVSSTEKRNHTVIGSTVHVEGKLSCDESITIHGTLKGTLTTKEELFIGAQAKVEADVSGKNIVISGTLNGNINASETVQLKSTAKVEGDITAGSIAIDAGATLKGTIATGGNTIAKTHTNTSTAKPEITTTGSVEKAKTTA